MLRVYFGGVMAFQIQRQRWGVRGCGMMIMGVLYECYGWVGGTMDTWMKSKGVREVGGKMNGWI